MPDAVLADNANWILQHQEENGRELLLTVCRVTFGRGRNCTFPLRSEYLSRQHAVMTLKDGQWRIKDLNSVNGVFIGSHRIRPNEEVDVNEGDLIGLGMPCSNTSTYYNGVYKLLRRPSNEVDVNRNEDDLNQKDVVNKEPSLCPVQNGVVDIIDLLEVKDLNMESSGMENISIGTSKRKIINSSSTRVPAPELVDLTSSDSEDNDQMEIKPSTSTCITQSDCHSASMASLKAADGLSLNVTKYSPEKVNPHVTRSPPKSSQTDENEVVDVNLGYSQDDEVIIISDDDDDDHCNLLKVKEEPVIKQEPNEYDEGYLYKQRLLEEIDWSDGSQAFTSDSGNLDVLPKIEPREWKDEWFSSPDINVTDDDSNENAEEIARNTFVGEFLNLSLQIDETRRQEENYDHKPDVSPSSLHVIHTDMVSDAYSNIPVCSSKEERLGDGGRQESANRPDINARLLALASNNDDFFPVLSQDFENECDSDDRTAIPEPISEPVAGPSHGKQRIAHDRLKQSSKNRNATTIPAQRMYVRGRGRPMKSVPQEGKKSYQKGKDLRSKVLKTYDNRVPMQGGGSDIRKSDVTPTAAVRVDRFYRNAPALPTAVAAKVPVSVANGNVKRGGINDINEQKKTSSAKVCVRAGASRNDMLAQSMSDHSTLNRPRKRIQLTNAKQMPSKKPRLSTDSFVAKPPEHLPKSNDTNRTRTANATYCPKSVDEHNVNNGQSYQSPAKFPPPVINGPATARITQPNAAYGQRDPRLARIAGGNPVHPSPSENKKQVTFDESRNETRIYQPSVNPCNRLNGRHVGDNSNNITTKTNVGDQFILDVLQWRPAWIEEQKIQKSPPPILASGQIKNVTISYKTQDEYEKTYGPLIKLECWEKITDDCAINSNLCSFQVVVTNARQETVNGRPYTKIYGYGVTNNKDRQFWRHGWLGILSVNVKPNGQFGSSNKSVLKPMFAFIDVCEKCNLEAVKTNPNTPLLLCKLLQNRDDFVFKLTIRVKSLFDEVLKDKSMKLQLASYLLPDIRLFETIHQLDNKKLRDFILRPDVNYFALSKKPSSPRPNFDGRGLNESQRNVVIRTTEMCLASPNQQSIGLIHGPPGTGKTKVIVSVIREILVALTGKVKILVCAPSNGAVDEITKRIIELRQQLKAKKISVHLVRIGQCGNMDDNVREFTMDKYLERHDEKEKDKENNSGANTHFFRTKILGRANVITTTLGSCTRAEMEGLKQSERIICIVDEATQCVEPESLLPLIYPFQKLILVGDHKQLPATIKSQTALTYGYNRSLFERLHLNFKEKENRPIMMLTIQHRMRHELCAYPSRKFYHEELRTAENLVTLGEEYPFCFYRVINVCDGQEMRLDKDIFNQNEVEFVLKLANTILDEYHVSIGIITFYSGQKKALEDSKDILLRENSKYVEVNTVDAFQGREKDVVILSAVRANPSGSVGFTCNSNRLNVALTRARYGLYIIGHMETLQSNPDWSELFRDAKQRNVYAGASSRFKKDLIAKIIEKK